MTSEPLKEFWPLSVNVPPPPAVSVPVPVIQELIRPFWPGEILTLCVVAAPASTTAMPLTSKSPPGRLPNVPSPQLSWAVVMAVLAAFPTAMLAVLSVAPLVRLTVALLVSALAVPTGVRLLFARMRLVTLAVPPLVILNKLVMVIV